jgi:SRSO17 transposase
MRTVVFFVLFVSSLFAVGSKVSHIPPVQSVFIDVEGKSCDKACLQELLDKGEVFSFLSRYNNAAEDEELQNRFYAYQTLFRSSLQETSNIRIAMLIPQKSIRRYAISTVNSVLAYLLSKNSTFDLKVFNSIDEKEDSILKTLKQIRRENFQYVIAPLTQEGAKTLLDNSKNLLVYIPTLNIHEFQNIDSNVIFGGIDYKAQILKLLAYANNKVSIFSDGSLLSRNLESMIKEQVPDIYYETTINNSRISFKRLLKYNKKIDNSSIFLNTPLVKTSLIASQFRVYDKKPYILLSTQINYNPLLLTLTQYEDRKNLFIANSIGKTSPRLEQTNSLFGHNIVYDWVNYTTSVGMDYIFTHYLAPSQNREFREEIKDNQVIYDISIYKAKRYKFVKELF